MSHMSWNEARYNFFLTNNDYDTFNIVIRAIPANIFHKIDFQSFKPW